MRQSSTTLDTAENVTARHATMVAADCGMARPTVAVVSLDGVVGRARAVATEPAVEWDGGWSPSGRASTRRVPAARLSGSVVALFFGLASLVWAVVVASAGCAIRLRPGLALFLALIDEERGVELQIQRAQLQP